jgi:hypothetical protein
VGATVIATVIATVTATATAATAKSEELPNIELS